MPQPALAKRSCSRCHGKKIKCNRELPQCTPCLRSQQTCLYEQRRRTPLTRKYLTQVENQLAEARALVRQYASGSQAESGCNACKEVTSDGRSEPSSSTFTLSADHAALPPQAHDSTSPHSSINQRVGGYDGQFESSGPQAQIQAPYIPIHHRMGQYAPRPKAITFPLEPTPGSISGNLEWDERHATRQSRPADGMGNLTEGGNDGYLGVASGASFLRLTELGQLPDDIGPEDAALSSTGGRNSPDPVPQQIPPPSRLDCFIDDYFSLFHPSYSIIHEATFRAEYMEVIPRPPGTLWHVLLYVVSALGACTSGKHPPGTDVVLFEAAKSRLSFDILETGSMMLVQVLALMANYVQKANKPNSGYNYLGLAKRVAVGIGLHKEYSDWAVNPWQIEMRRRVWWCLVIFDVGASVTFSRPIELPTGIDIDLPQNFRDTDLTRATGSFPAEATETTVYSNLRCQALFDLAIQDIYSALISGTYPSPETLLSLDDSLIGRWLADLPPYFQDGAPQPRKFAASHTILHLRCRNFKIIMYRPFVIRSAILQNRARATNADHDSGDEAQPPDANSPINHAIGRCLAAAADTIATVSSFWFGGDGDGGNKTPMACWYGIYFLFQAVIIPIVSLRNEPSSPAADAWRAQVRQAVRALEDMAVVNATAGRCLRVVGRLCGPFLGRSEAVATEESPATQLNELSALLWPLEAAQFEYGGVPGDRGITDFFNQLPGFQWE